MQPNYQLISQILTCQKCRLSQSRNLAVPAEIGTRYSGLAIMGEAPGAQEDLKGRPMVGRAGELLERMLTGAGLTRESVMILNRVRCRPPRNRLQDYPEATLNCDEWTQAELAAYQPSVVVLMGKTALQAVFGKLVGVGETRGMMRQTSEEFAWGARSWVATYHPAAALRNPELIPIIIKDLKQAKALLV